MDQAKAYALYEKMVAAHARVELKGDTVPYTSLNGHMFSALHKGGRVALRLPSPDREAFLKKYKTSLAAHYGTGPAGIRGRAGQASGQGHRTETLFRHEYDVRRFAQAKGKEEGLHKAAARNQLH